MNLNLPLTIDDARTCHVVKRPIPVKVTFARDQGVCPTLEGSVQYAAGDAILTGIQGENWPIRRERFEQTYAPCHGTVLGMDGTYVKKPLPVLALCLDQPATVPVASGGQLRGEPGDWLLEYGANEYGIVRDSIFRATYEILPD